MTSTAAAAAAARVRTARKAGPKSGTSWIVTSSPAFSILGKEGPAPDPDDAVLSYRSPATSLRGLVVSTDEPLCSLHILLATESNGGGGGGGGLSEDGASPPSPAAAAAWHHPDDGLPHTLEHLVFLGSKTHPHKGVLDKLANRCMADGTNAWTATDHTAYTLSTAGSEGALNLLPIFADHVLFPTLTDSGESCLRFLRWHCFRRYSSFWFWRSISYDALFLAFPFALMGPSIPIQSNG